MIYKKTHQRRTEEYDFIVNFLESGYFDRFKNDKYNVSLIHEPFTQLGYTDLVCIKWKKDILDKWKAERNNLVKNDIKILHHLYNCRVFKTTEEIVGELGFSIKQVKETLSRLSKAETIITNKAGKVKIKPLNEIFFLKEIIAIEAKLKDWKRALEQSQNNVLFSSKSFSLFPEKTINSKLIDNYKQTDVGVLSFDSKYRELIKPKNIKIPTAITSWYLNEYIGRNCWSSC